ncbi:MAG: UDP-glucose 4-epimerase GalE [Clostridiales bacterium]|nr:UDP-glucose 4-epimerase GalE [Clostridiales bacterium]
MCEKRSKILLTGGAGYIGSHTAVALLERGYDVVVFDSLVNSKASVMGCVGRIAGREPELVVGDIRDEAALGRLFSEHGFCAVVHFAGLKDVAESVAEPQRYHEVNVGGSMSLYRAMEVAGARTLIYSSSATVYGAGNPAPYTEDMELSPINPYGQTKLENEQALRGICAADSAWSVALLRYFNPAGAHPSGLLGEDPKGVPNNLLPYVAKVAAGELERVHIYGDDYDTLDGTGVRDYIHVMDLARGHVMALEWLGGGERAQCGTIDDGFFEVGQNLRRVRRGTAERLATASQGFASVSLSETPCSASRLRRSTRSSGPYPQDTDRRIASAGGAVAINLGTGKGTSVREMVAAFEAVCGCKLPTAVVPRRAGDLASAYANVDFARELLGFEAEHGIEDICADAWRWQQRLGQEG